MPFRRKFRTGARKPSVKHSGSLLANTGSGSIVAKLVILKTSGGPRSTTGAPQTIQSLASTDDDCRTGDTCKLVNLHIQCGPRSNVGVAEDRTGWLEWAFVCVRENETEVANTRIGVQTLGDIATQMYRGECIFTGNIPVGTGQPSSSEITLKVPKQKCKIKLGDEWRFLTYFRAVSSTSTATDSNRLVKSYNYKVTS